jgi:hypothetical protein
VDAGVDGSLAESGKKGSGGHVGVCIFTGQDLHPADGADQWLGIAIHLDTRGVDSVQMVDQDVRVE